MDVPAVVARLRQALRGRSDVRLALLFGSRARGSARPGSDIDVAVAAPGTDRDALDLVSFNLMLAVQACSDIASHLIADEGWPAASTLAGAFNRLRDQGVVSASTAASLSRAVGLRDVVAHGYAGINPAMVHAAATLGAGDLDAFAREVAAWAARQAAPS